MTSELKPGDDAPLFILPSSDGKKVNLTAYRGKSHVILYFYPKDDTPAAPRRRVLSEILSPN